MSMVLNTQTVKKEKILNNDIKKSEKKIFLDTVRAENETSAKQRFFDGLIYYYVLPHITYSQPSL